MKITSDKISARAAQPSIYAATFEQLTHEKNCLVFDDKKEMDRTAQALEKWAQRYLPGAKVRTTGRYPKDGKPRCWLIFPPEAIPPKTVISGNWPKGAK